jgi:hypothetical protein
MPSNQTFELFVVIYADFGNPFEREAKSNIHCGSAATNARAQ